MHRHQCNAVFACTLSLVVTEVRCIRGVNLEQVSHLSQGQLTCLYVLGAGDEARAPGANPCRPGEDIQIPHSSVPAVILTMTSTLVANTTNHHYMRLDLSSQVVVKAEHGHKVRLFDPCHRGSTRSLLQCSAL